MHRSNLVAIFLLLAMACLAACQSTDTVPPIASAVDKRVPPNPDFLPGSDSYTYKSVDGIELRLHVFNNSDGVAKPKPAIVFFFGGGLRKGSVTQFEFQAKALSKLGMLAVVADYRVKLRHNTGHTEAIADAQAVIRWLRDHAEQLKLDPSRLVAAGGSSGGYLAAATATVADIDEARSTVSSKPNAIALFNPALANRFPRAEATFSPYDQLRDQSVPTFIVHGTADEIVPFASALAYCDKVIALGGHCELHRYEDAGHGFFNPGRNGNQYHLQTLAQLKLFLKEQGYLEFR